MESFCETKQELVYVKTSCLVFGMQEVLNNTEFSGSVIETAQVLQE